MYYVTDGTEEIRSGATVHKLYPGIGSLIPEEVVATITNTGNVELAGYLWVEPVPAGFTPRPDLMVRDTNVVPMSKTGGHWAYHGRRIFEKDEGLAVLVGFAHITLKPMTMAQPHTTRGTDVVWVALDGEIYTLFGKRFYHLQPGTAIKNPGDGKAYHANINVSDYNEIHLIWSRTIPLNEFK